MSKYFQRIAPGNRALIVHCSPCADLPQPAAVCRGHCQTGCWPPLPTGPRLCSWRAEASGCAGHHLACSSHTFPAYSPAPHPSWRRTHNVAQIVYITVISISEVIWHRWGQVMSLKSRQASHKSKSKLQKLLYIAFLTFQINNIWYLWPTLIWL